MSMIGNGEENTVNNKLQEIAEALTRIEATLNEMNNVEESK